MESAPGLGPGGRCCQETQQLLLKPPALSEMKSKKVLLLIKGWFGDKEKITGRHHNHSILAHKHNHCK